jgi:hypothetical protein
VIIWLFDKRIVYWSIDSISSYFLRHSNFLLPFIDYLNFCDIFKGYRPISNKRGLNNRVLIYGSIDSMIIEMVGRYVWWLSGAEIEKLEGISNGYGILGVTCLWKPKPTKGCSSNGRRKIFNDSHVTFNDTFSATRVFQRRMRWEIDNQLKVDAAVYLKLQSEHSPEQTEDNHETKPREELGTSRIQAQIVVVHVVHGVPELRPLMGLLLIPIWLYLSMESYSAIILTGENRINRRETCHNIILSVTNPTDWTRREPETARRQAGN